MTTAAKRKLAHAVADRGAYWTGVLNLDHWRIDVEVVDELDNPDALASCAPDDSYDSAKIRVRADLDDHRGDDQTLDYIIVHELLHVYLRNLDETFQAAVGSLGMMGDGHRSRWRHEEENMIDRLAHCIVNLNQQKVVPSEPDESTT